MDEISHNFLGLLRSLEQDEGRPRQCLQRDHWRISTHAERRNFPSPRKGWYRQQDDHHLSVEKIVVIQRGQHSLRVFINVEASCSSRVSIRARPKNQLCLSPGMTDEIGKETVSYLPAQSSEVRDKFKVRKGNESRRRENLPHVTRGVIDLRVGAARLGREAS